MKHLTNVVEFLKEHIDKSKQQIAEEFADESTKPPGGGGPSRSSSADGGGPTKKKTHTTRSRAGIRNDQTEQRQMGIQPDDDDDDGYDPEGGGDDNYGRGDEGEEGEPVGDDLVDDFIAEEMPHPDVPMTKNFVTLMGLSIPVGIRRLQRES